MITNGKDWHYLEVTKLSAILKEITSKNNGYLYCLNCLHSFKTKNKLRYHMKVWEDFCGILMSSQKDNTLKFDQYMKSNKIPYIGYSLSTLWAFVVVENKHTLNRGQNSMKKFCSSLKEHSTNVIDYQKKKMLPLTKKI